MKKKLLFVVPRLAIAGTEKHVLNLARGLDRSKYDVTICCLFEIGRLSDEYRSDALRVVCLGRKSVYDLRIMHDLFCLMRRERYDIVHTYLFGFHYLATVPAKIAKVPSVISARRELASWKRWYHCLLEDMGNLFTDKVVACSEAVKRFSLRNENLPGDKVVVLFNGIDLEIFSPRQKNSGILNEFGLKDTDRIIGMVANFSAVKNHKGLLEALVEVKRLYPEIKCLLVGDGALRGEIENRVKDLDLVGNVIFTGIRNDIFKVLTVLDIFVLTSISEGVPNAVLEAMACGVPVVATNVGGVAEAIENGKSGLLTDPQDHRAVANAIVHLLGNITLRRQMAGRGREITEERFDFKNMLANYEELYNTLFPFTQCQ